MRVDDIVYLKVKQTYQGCIGVITDIVPKSNTYPSMFKVYVDRLGTIVRKGSDLVIADDSLLTEVEIMDPQVWLAKLHLEQNLTILAAMIIRNAPQEDISVCTDRCVTFENMLNECKNGAMYDGDKCYARHTEK